MIQDFYSKLSDTGKKIFYVAVVCVFLAFVDRLFLGPVLSKLHSLDETIVRQENSIQRDLRFLAYKQRILEENKRVTPYYLSGSRTEEEIIAGFLKRLEILATEANINLIKVTPSEGEPKKGYIEYLAGLECNGKLEQVVRFMYLVDSSDELMKVEKLALSPRRGSTDEVDGTMTISKIIVHAEDFSFEETTPEENVPQLLSEDSANQGLTETSP